METTSVDLRPADDLGYVERLLAENDLPTDDVRANPDCFRVATVDGDPVGVGGLQAFESVGLLRSVAVERRGRGYGTAICDELEAEARSDGIDSLYLLTTSARGFFADRGYRTVDRERAPERIRRTREFEDLCSSSATCMRKRL